MIILDPEFGCIIKAEAGDIVWDDLLRVNAVIVRVDFDQHGNVGYWLNNDYLGGGRHPWEISPAREFK